MLLVDDQKPKVTEFNVILQQFVRTDQDINFAGLGIGQNGFLLFGADKPRQHFNPDRPVGKAVTEVFKMLLRQQCCRHQNRHLMTIIHCDKRSAHGHFSFTKTNITTDQPVHCPRRLHIAQHRINRIELIGSFLKRKAIGKALIGFSVNFKTIAFLTGAQGVDIKQFCRDVPYFFCRFTPGFVPGVMTEFM